MLAGRAPQIPKRTNPVHIRVIVTVHTRKTRCTAKQALFALPSLDTLYHWAACHTIHTHGRIIFLRSPQRQRGVASAFVVCAAVLSHPNPAGDAEALESLLASEAAKGTKDQPEVASASEALRAVAARADEEAEAARWVGSAGPPPACSRRTQQSVACLRVLLL